MGQALCPADAPAGFQRSSAGGVSGSPFRGKRSNDARQSLEELVQQQKRKCYDIIEELDRFGKKVSHWIWWICPTDVPGCNDPYGTYVTKETAHGLFGEQAAEQEW
eukprot:CAMPEP_0206455242 /NCGR_PEP_ID=MMETSP0324_2-20121206/21638_1 /ASSEMBLY_ACC=CAM_ASM_000836 /TAXON_ID=2866 /ORGANISM="Crypthecodinium cohnii, Strain Seligo" /LENGTH=105 /DNA_ID=CAMNT_0053925913 /DNA_START=348 /DNA_END=662 /DNA_ORIENTATION=+